MHTTHKLKIKNWVSRCNGFENLCTQQWYTGEKLIGWSICSNTIASSVKQAILSFLFNTGKLICHFSHPFFVAKWGKIDRHSHEEIRDPSPKPNDPTLKQRRWPTFLQYWKQCTVCHSNYRKNKQSLAEGKGLPNSWWHLSAFLVTRFHMPQLILQKFHITSNLKFPYATFNSCAVWWARICVQCGKLSIW